MPKILCKPPNEISKLSLEKVHSYLQSRIMVKIEKFITTKKQRRNDLAWHVFCAINEKLRALYDHSRRNQRSN